MMESEEHDQAGNVKMGIFFSFKASEVGFRHVKDRC